MNLFKFILAISLFGLVSSNSLNAQTLHAKNKIMSLPYYSLGEWKYSYGMIDAYKKTNSFERNSFPKIPHLYVTSCMEICPLDTCKSERAVIAINCPNKKTILNWISNQVCKFANICMSPLNIDLQDGEEKDSIQPKYIFNSNKDLCDFYRSKIDNYFKKYTSKCIKDVAGPTEQNVIFIAECWHKMNFYTFMKYYQYDQSSCGDNSQVSYITVNSETGKQIRTRDIFRPSDFHKLGKLILQYLRNGNGLWSKGDNASHNLNENIEQVLSNISGCGFLSNGIVFYYHPYQIGSGADGHYFALIPYNKIKNAGIRMRLPFNKLD